MTDKHPHDSGASDLYKILNVHESATQNEIKDAYILQVRRFPPEKDPEHFKQIRRAYEILSNPKSRSDYDSQKKYGPAIEKLLEEAQEHHGDEEYEAAIQCLKKVLVLSPTHSIARDLLGRCYLEKELYEDAVHCFRVLIEHDPSNGIHQYNLGMAYFRLKQFADAEKTLLHATTLRPFDSDILTALADVFIKQKKFDEAILTLDRAVSMDSKVDMSDLPYFLKMMEVYILSNNKDKIEHLLDEIDYIVPPDSDAKRYMAFRLAFFSQKLSEVQLYSFSARLIRKALEYDPSNAKYKTIYEKIKAMDPEVYILQVNRPDQIWENSLFVEEIARLSKRSLDNSLEFLKTNASFRFRKLTLERANIYFNRLAKYPLGLKIMHSEDGQCLREHQGLHKQEFKQAIIILKCSGCGTSNRILEHLKDKAFCSKCGLLLTMRSVSQNVPTDERVDLYIWYKQERIQHSDFCKSVGDIFDWDLTKTKEYLAAHQSVLVSDISKSEAERIWQLFESYSVEMQIVPHGKTPSRKKTRASSTQSNSSKGWGWLGVICIVLYAIVVNLSNSTKKSTTDTRSIYRSSSAASRSYSSPNYAVSLQNSYVDTINSFYKTAAELREIKFDNANAYTIDTKLQEFRAAATSLRTINVPSKFSEGHKIVLNGAAILEEAYGKIVNVLKYTDGVSESEVNQLNDMLERGSFLLQQGHKQLKSAS